MSPRRGVSVVLCCHSDERWDDICGALSSVRNQVSATDEIIVAVDHAPELSRRVHGTFRDATVVDNRSVRGLSGARNAGIAAAHAEIVAFLDDDAVAADDWLERLCEPYDDPAVVAVAGRVAPRWVEKRPAWFPAEFDWVVGCTHAGHPDEGPIDKVIGANISFRRSMLEEIGGFDERDERVERVSALPAGCEETELCLRLRQRRHDAIVWYAASAVVHLRVRPEHATFAYFNARCLAEGGSKTRVTRMLRGCDGLANERSYASRTLPRAAGRDLNIALGRQGRGALSRVGVRAAGVALIGVGFATRRVREYRPIGTRSPKAAAFRPALVSQVDIAVSGGIAGGTSIDGSPYERAFLLVRDHGRPCASLEVALSPDGLSAPRLEQQLREAIERGDVVVPSREESPASCSTAMMSSQTPLVTVVVATRDRPEELRRCVDSILACDYPDFDVLIVDNAPTSSAVPKVADASVPGRRVRWTREKTPGLARAHNRALQEVTAPFVAFTDDDVVVDKDWLSKLVAGFRVAPDVGCVTGMIFPLELETGAQEVVERWIGYNKGFARRIYRDDRAANRHPLFPYATGMFGSGANMAFRTAALRSIGGFDAALGTGTRTRGGDDLAAFFDIVAAGHTLVYEPSAIVFHAHRRDESALARQAFGNGTGLTAYLTKTLADRPSRVFDIAARVPAGLRYALVLSSERNARLPDGYPRSLIALERAGMLAGPALYLASRYSTRRVQRLARSVASGHSSVVSAVAE